MPATSLVFGASSEDLASLLARATSFSCSLGAAMRRVMTSTLTALPEVVSETDVAIETRKEQLRSRKLRKRRQFDLPTSPPQTGFIPVISLQKKTLDQYCTAPRTTTSLWLD